VQKAPNPGGKPPSLKIGPRREKIHRLGAHLSCRRAAEGREGHLSRAWPHHRLSASIPPEHRLSTTRAPLHLHSGQKLGAAAARSAAPVTGQTLATRRAVCLPRILDLSTDTDFSFFFKIIVLLPRLFYIQGQETEIANLN